MNPLPSTSAFSSTHISVFPDDQMSQSIDMLCCFRYLTAFKIISSEVKRGEFAGYFCINYFCR